MNVSSLTPPFSDLHTLLYLAVLVIIIFFNLLLSFFWLCEEAKRIYLHLLLGQKSPPAVLDEEQFCVPQKTLGNVWSHCSVSTGGKRVQPLSTG